MFGLRVLSDFFSATFSSLQQYCFHSLERLYSLRDVPDLRNDLAFLLHMLDQYDPLLAQRLSVFLSPVSESRLLEEGLGRRWGEERLRAVTTVDADGCSRLQLVALPRLPPALFTLSQLQVLKLELITDALFTTQVADMSSLRSAPLPLCMASLFQQLVLFFLKHLLFLLQQGAPPLPLQSSCGSRGTWSPAGTSGGPAPHLYSGI